MLKFPLDLSRKWLRKVYAMNAFVFLPLGGFVQQDTAPDGNSAALHCQPVSLNVMCSLVHFSSLDADGRLESLCQSEEVVDCFLCKK